MFIAGGPLPRFEGINIGAGQQSMPAPLQAQNSGPIRVPPLTPERVGQYTSLFEESGAQNGTLPGKHCFDRELVRVSQIQAKRRR